ncbi:hypothetical protein [Streptomyces sp. NBC_01198]|uniref:hypothetical protein n=1 Tax=Streptomyces sp. NBC_01198 TaxID=2903769 RepID=UPI002E0F02C3|nr:hypothetical protein OG702_00080 [Streptomyces sp. NBC_01198]WSR66425.1 hypothetical protein OG702_35280 [Streptomyces sp. NBC_01198]
MGLHLGVLTGRTYTVIILVAISTSAMAPPLIRIAMRHIDHAVEERLRLRDAVPAPAADTLRPALKRDAAAVDRDVPVRTESMPEL